MTLYEFKSFDLDRQAEFTWDHGVLLGFRDEKEKHMILYSLQNFYVEIQYDAYQNDIIGIISFISDDPLLPYLDRIDITDLLSQ
jgi:hypothetical protein